MSSFFGLLERNAPVVTQNASATSQVEKKFQNADANWKRNVSKLENAKAKFELKKLKCSSSDFARMQDEICYLENQVAISHQAMSEALRALEEVQYLNSKKWELAEKKQKLEVLKTSIDACDVELAELNAIEQSIPLKRLKVVGKRQSLWNEFAQITEEVRSVENAHS